MPVSNCSQEVAIIERVIGSGIYTSDMSIGVENVLRAGGVCERAVR